jgi:glyoxylate reductase
MKSKYSNYNVVLTQKIPEPALQLLKGAGFSVRVLAPSLLPGSSEFIRRVKNADALICLLSDKISREVIEGMPRCKVIANYAVGYNNIAIDYAKERNIIVTNTPDVLTDATAEIAMALLLSASRNVIPGEKMVRSGAFTGWKPDLLRGPQLTGKTIGIVGAGRIGRATAVRAAAFGMKIVYYSRSKNTAFEAATGAKKVTLDRLMKTSDVISVHIPLTTETRGIINKELLSQMKPQAIFINSARGEVVDETFLISLLRQKKIFAAGFDVYTNEPVINPALLALDNVVLLPHLGSATFEARAAMAEIAARNVISVLKGKKALTQVY